MTTPETTPETAQQAAPQAAAKAAKKKPSATGRFLRDVTAGRAEVVHQAPAAPKAKKKPTKVRVNLYLAPEMADRLRDALVAVGRGYTLGTLVEEVLPDGLAALEKKHNGGKPFPPRPDSAKTLPTGPPVQLDRQES